MTPAVSLEFLIARLLELPRAERAGFLRDACEQHPDLAMQLQQVAQVIGGADATSAPSLSDSERARLLEFAIDAEGNVGGRIGPYTLVQQLGEGGFGVVWLAEQQAPVRRRVALKIIKSGMDTREVIARFDAERQALALMDHPHIARVLDAGETDAGQPYFVMDLVRGVPITSYCDEHRLTTAARLELFVSVCHAVQHAHQKGVIHRDLKPSNILVTLHDGTPAPKIIDFGIAKATEGRLTEKTLFTHLHTFIGTPAYTSPEQMEMGGVDVDTRSDIYSLGVVLYELLAGRPPFDPDELLKSGLDAMRHTIRETDPPRPSERLRTLSSAMRADVARQHHTEEAKLGLLLRGDLDWIVMHCLEKDRSRRYATASDLAADVRRYLSDEMVTARPPSARYRLRKLIRRHKLGFAAGTATAVAVLVGLVLSSVLLVREQTARKNAVAAEATESHLRQEAELGRAREIALREQADADAKRAQTAAAKSEQVAQFMKDMLHGVGPSVALGRDTTLLREVLDRTAQRLDHELGGQPEIASSLRDTLGMVYFELGHYTTAETLLRSAVASRRTLFGNDHAALATSLDHLGRVLSSLNTFAEAELVHREALAIRRRLHGNEHPEVATALHHLATALRGGGKEKEAEMIRRDVLTLRRKLLGDEHPDVAASIASLGAHEESLAMRRRLLGNAHPDVASSLVGFGDVLPVRAQDRALEVYREAFGIRRNVFGDGHPQVTATLLRYLSALAFQSPLEEAAPLARDIIASTRKNLGNDSVALAPSLLALGALLHGEPKHANETDSLIEEARALLARSPAGRPPLDSETIYAMREFASSMFLSGQPERGIAMAEAMVQAARALFGAEHAFTIDAVRPLAWTYFFAGRVAEARLLFEDNVVRMRRLRGPDHPMSLILLSGVAAANRELGDFPRARHAIEEGLALLRDTPGAREEPDPAIATVLSELGFVLNHETNFFEAEKVFRESLTHHERAKPDAVFPRHRPRGETVSGLALALAGQGRFDEAEALVVQAFHSLGARETALSGSRHKFVRDALERVAQVYTAWGKTEKAAEWRAKISALDAAAVHPSR